MMEYLLKYLLEIKNCATIHYQLKHLGNKMSFEQQQQNITKFIGIIWKTVACGLALFGTIIYLNLMTGIWFVSQSMINKNPEMSVNLIYVFGSIPALITTVIFACFMYFMINFIKLKNPVSHMFEKLGFPEVHKNRA